MDYGSESIEAEIYRLRTKTRELEIEIDTLNTQNVRLAKENSELANDLNLRTIESKTATSINAELRMMLFKAENERDELNGSLQSLKQKYNKLYDKYAVNDRTFRAINQTFRDVNRLGPIVKPDQSRPKFQRPESNLPKLPSEYDTITLELKQNLDKAYDKIEELEFELESLEVLEHENQHLRSELNEFKRKKSIDLSLPSSPSTSLPSTPQTTPKKKTFNITSAIFNQISSTQQQQQEHSTSLSSSILRTSATISPSSSGDFRYSTATTVTPEEFQGYNKNNPPIQTPIHSSTSSSQFYIENENIYEAIDQRQYTTNKTSTRNNIIDWAIIDDNNDQSIDRNDGNNFDVVENDNESFRKKPNITKKPSFLSGARQSIGGDENANESKKMINLVDELQQFKFKNSSQGPKNV